jgi:hypothetical protein
MARVMAKIMKRGKGGTQVARYHCDSKRCGSDIEYSKSDVQTDPRGESYVVCPVCECWIDVAVLNWEWIKNV